MGDAMTLNSVADHPTTAHTGHSETTSECRRDSGVSAIESYTYDDDDRAVPMIVPMADPPVDGEKNGTALGACRRCGTAFEPGAGRCVKCKSFAFANQEARGLGLQAHHHPVELRMTADELMAGVASDRGGDADLSTLERAYIRKLGDLEICIRILTENIAGQGLLTPGGRVRDVYDKLLVGLDRFDRYAQRVGITRKAKRIDLARRLSGLDR